MIKHAVAAVCAVFLLVAPAIPADREDHPLITRYEGATAADKEVRDFEPFRLIVGLDGDSFKFYPLEGRITRLRYESPAGRSETEIFENYVQSLKDAGFEEVWRCADNDCGPAYAASRWNRFNGTINLGANSRYAAGRIMTAGGEAYVAIAVAPRQHQVTVVEVKAMEEGLVKVDPEALGRDLDAKGHVAIPGVYFDTGKATLKPESGEALSAMAAILAARPDLKVWVVGHTDWVGELKFNMNLSDARAKAVVDALVKDHALSRQRLEGHGVGPLSPAAANTTDGGRTANRRVELVARPD